MTLDYNPIGFHVLESQNPAADLAYWRQLKPYSMTFTQRVFGMVKEAHDTIPQLRVICIRTVLDNEGEKTLHEHADYKEMVRAFKEFVDVHNLDYNRVYLSLWCEPDLRGSERGAILKWTVEAMRYAWSQGVRCAVLGVGMATLESWDWLSGDFNELMLELSTGWHILRVHGYYGPVAYAGAAGGLADVYLSAELAQEKYAPSPYDVQEGSSGGNWFVGRIFTGIVPLCKKLNIPLPRMIQDEGGPDRHESLEWVELGTGQWVNIYGNLESDPPVGYARDEMIDGDIKHLKVPWPHWGMRGWNTLRWVWKAYYPDMEPGDVLAMYTFWEIFVHIPYLGGKSFIEAWQLFAWCPGHLQWDIQHGFDTSKDEALKQALQRHSDAIYAQQPPGPDPEPQPDPPPDELPFPMWKAVLLGVLLFTVVLAATLGAFFLAAHMKRIGAQSAGGYLMETLQIMPVDQAGQVLVAAIMAIIAGGMSSPVTVPIVNLVKFILAKVGQEDAVSGNVLAALVAAVVTVVIWVSRWIGVELQVNNVLDLLQTVIPPVVTFLGMFAGQKSLFSWAVRKEIPMVGYQRTPQ